LYWTLIGLEDVATGLGVKTCCFRIGLYPGGGRRRQLYSSGSRPSGRQ